MKNKQKLIEQKEHLYKIKKQSLILSSLFENEFLQRLGSKKALEEWRDSMLDDMNRLKKEIQDLNNNLKK
jgi:hypothetical protein